MTCLVGVEDNGVVYLGADSVGIRPSLDLQARRDKKLFRNGGISFAAAGSFRVAQLLKFALQVPDRPASMSVESYLYGDLVDAIRIALFMGGALVSGPSGQMMASELLMAYQGKLYQIGVDFQMAEANDGFMASGIGDSIALGSLRSTIGADPVERVRLALEAAEAYSGGVRGPFYVLDSTGNAPNGGALLSSSNELEEWSQALSVASSRFDEVLPSV